MANGRPLVQGAGALGDPPAFDCIPVNAILLAKLFYVGSRFAPLIKLRSSLGEHVIFRQLFTGGIQEFARDLAGDIARRYPAAIANSPEPLVSPRRRSEILENTFLRARQFSLENKLGLLARFRLENALKWHLKEMGYDEQFIDMATEYLLASTARESK